MRLIKDIYNVLGLRYILTTTIVTTILILGLNTGLKVIVNKNYAEIQIDNTSSDTTIVQGNMTLTLKQENKSNK